MRNKDLKFDLKIEVEKGYGWRSCDMLDSKQIKQLHLLECFAVVFNINTTAVTKRKQVVLLWRHQPVDLPGIGGFLQHLDSTLCFSLPAMTPHCQQCVLKIYWADTQRSQCWAVNPSLLPVIINTSVFLDVLTYRVNIVGEAGFMWLKPVALQLPLQTNYVHWFYKGERPSVRILRQCTQYLMLAKSNDAPCEVPPICRVFN